VRAAGSPAPGLDKQAGRT